MRLIQLQKRLTFSSILHLVNQLSLVSPLCKRKIYSINVTCSSESISEFPKYFLIFICIGITTREYIFSSFSKCLRVHSFILWLIRSSTVTFKMDMVNTNCCLGHAGNTQKMLNRAFLLHILPKFTFFSFVIIVLVCPTDTISQSMQELKE